MLPLLPSPAGLFIYDSMRVFPSPTFGAQGTPPSLLRVFIFLLLLIIQFLFFSLVGCRSVQGAMLIWPRIVCGSTTYRLAHLVVCVFPSGLGTGIWWSGSPPGFSVQHEVGILCMGWGCGGVKVLPLVSGFSCQVYLQDFTLGSKLSASSL
jgi:hypothetical protein